LSAEISARIPMVSQGSIPSSNNAMPDASALGGYQYSGPADNIDERDTDDPLCVTSYVQDMYEHFRSKEIATSVRPVYMEDQQYINERMRSILVDWLVEVHLKFKLVPETLYLTINIIDRYLAKTEVTRPKLQLVGVTALLIASKYEEIYPPELRDLVYICDRAYSKNEVRNVCICPLNAHLVCRDLSSLFVCAHSFTCLFDSLLRCHTDP
jgi:cyclin B